MNEKKLEKKLINIICSSLYFFLVMFLTLLLIKYVGQRTEVIGSSMAPTLTDGDNLVVDKLTYKFREPRRGDIIVFPYRDRSNVFYIKRIIALPGETIYINEKSDVYINGELYQEDYLMEAYMEDPGVAGVPFTLKEGEYFVMGDNRNNSTDSRKLSIGTVKREEITGRAFMRIWPLTKIKILKHS